MESEIFHFTNIDYKYYIYFDRIKTDINYLKIFPTLIRRFFDKHTDFIGDNKINTDIRLLIE